MEDKDYGYIKIKLSELIKDRKISKNKLAHRAEITTAAVKLRDLIRLSCLGFALLSTAK